MSLDGVLGDGKPCRDYFVRTALSDVPQYFNLPSSKDVIASVFGHFQGYLGRNPSHAGMSQPNGINQLCTQHAFQKVTNRSRLEGPQSLNVSSVCRQDDDTSI